jgi:hypothetical protein
MGSPASGDAAAQLKGRRARGRQRQGQLHPSARPLAHRPAQRRRAGRRLDHLAPTGTFSAETSRRLACDASRVVMRHDEDGRTLEVGARTRTIPPALRRALHHRDHGCRFPGCGLPFGQGHHVRHWAQGGPTTLSNLALLCRRHPPRGSRGGLSGRSTARRRASVAAAGRPAPARGPGAGRGARGSGPGAPGTARCAGTPPPRADGVPVLAGGALGCGLRDRRVASAGHRTPGIIQARGQPAFDGMIAFADRWRA